MPTSSVAAAAARGTLLQTKVLGRAPSAGSKRASKKENDKPGSQPSFPPRQPPRPSQRGPGMRPSSAGAAAPPAEDDVLEPTSWGASDPAIRQQLDRELRAIRDQLALRQQITQARSQLRETGPEFSSAAVPERLSSPLLSEAGFSLASLGSQEAPPADKEAGRLARRVQTFEATVVRKLVARTPAGPSGVGALRVLTRAFEHYDQEKDGTTDVAGLTRVLARINVIGAIPPSQPEKELIQAFYTKYAPRNGGELAYHAFAKRLLHANGTLVSASEEMSQQTNEAWQYSTAVNQALARRNLAGSRTRPPDMAIDGREAWVDASAAARAYEEGYATPGFPHDGAFGPGVPPRSGVEAGSAALRGRLAGGTVGLKEYRKLQAVQRQQAAASRAEGARQAAGQIEYGRQVADQMVREAVLGWNRIKETNERLGGLTPGEAEARGRRNMAL